MAKKVNKTEEQFAQVESGLTKSAIYIEKNWKLLSIIVGAIALIIGGYIGYNNYIVKPNILAADESLYIAEFYLEQGLKDINSDDDSIKTLAKQNINFALNGDGQNIGFLTIANNYSSTKAGNLSQYYAARCQYELGKYQDALSLMEKFDTDDKIFKSISFGFIGDCNIQLGKVDEALENYESASSEEYKNEITTPRYLMKQAQVYAQKKNNHCKALDIYNIISLEYNKQKEKLNIQKYISVSSLRCKK